MPAMGCNERGISAVWVWLALDRPELAGVGHHLGLEVVGADATVDVAVVVGVGGLDDARVRAPTYLTAHLG